ncbi:MAG: hypothetical protein C0401_06445 [Anaerolinea sp.]|nr:hypothetical protein [Anaerolinea sp.]
MEKLLNIFRKSRKWLVIFLISIFTIIVFSFIFKGYFSRYLQDDYCYGADVRNKGFFTAQIDAYFGSTEYNGNRYALTFTSGVAEIIGGTKVERWFPGLSIIIWFFSLAFLIQEFQHIFLHKAKLSYSILISLFILTFTLYLAPDLFQVFYWRSGRLPYQTSLIINTYLIARTLQLSRHQRIKWYQYVEFITLGFFSAGFSETTTVIQFAIWSLLLFGNLIGDRKKQKPSLTNLLIITLITVTFIGILLLAFSPSNAFRLNAAWVKKPDFPTFIVKSFRFGLDFLRYSLHDKWLPFAIVFVFGFMINKFIESPLVFSKKKIGINAIIIIVTAYLLSVSSTMPTLIIRSVYPEDRAWFPIHYILVCTVLTLGYLLAEFLSLVNFSKSLKLFQSLLLGVLFIGLLAYSIRMIPLLYNGIPELSTRALAWDRREVWILQEKHSGKTHVKVPAFDSIGRLTELKPDEGNWVNICAARYYAIDGIAAIENYNGVKPYFK